MMMMVMIVCISLSTIVFRSTHGPISKPRHLSLHPGPKLFDWVHSSNLFVPDQFKTIYFVRRSLKCLIKQNKKENSMLWSAYSVGTLYCGYLFDKNLASSVTHVLIGQHMNRPDADSFSAKNMWAWQTSSTCAIEIDPEINCIPFKPLIKNSLPTKPEKKKKKDSSLFTCLLLVLE